MDIDQDLDVDVDREVGAGQGLGGWKLKILLVDRTSNSAGFRADGFGILTIDKNLSSTVRLGTQALKDDDNLLRSPS